MAGLTIIHLSDLHIGKRQREGWFPTESQRLPAEEKQFLTEEADRLAADFLYLSGESGPHVSFRTEETVLLVTGDITHACRWWQYELALWFFQELRRAFAGRFPGESILPGRILCIPGNHDLCLPSPNEGPSRLAGVDKYRDFKLFLDLVTDYAPYARQFSLALDTAKTGGSANAIPAISPETICMNVPGPLQVRFLDLNSCLGVNCLSPDSRCPDSRPGFPQAILSHYAQLLASPPGSITVALMHHSIADLPPVAEGQSRVDQAFLGEWLRNHRIRLLLTGHAHRQRGGGTTDEQGVGLIMARTTGPTFRYTQGGPCSYEVLRLGLKKDPVAYPRTLIARTEDAPAVWEKTGKHLKPDGIDMNLHWADLAAGRELGLPASLLGCADNDGWAIVSHCESGKFQNYGILSPGETINASLIEHFDSSRGNLVKAVSGFEVEYPPGTDMAGKHVTAWPLFEKQCVFLVDSPRYNGYVGWVLDHYGTHMAGARVTFRDNLSESPRRQEIIVCGKTLVSDQGQGGDLFGPYTDYLLVMRLPGLVPSKADSTENRRCADPGRKIWVVAGIHSKASQAGAILFHRTNLPFFAEALMRQCGGGVPEFFEAVYEVPPSKTRPLRGGADMDFLDNPEHFRVLQLKTKVGMSDGQPPGLAARFRSGADWGTIPLETVHLDPVAGCNHRCSTCIESALREHNTYLSLSTCLKVLTDLKTVGCRRVDLYGGEPTLHPAFPELLRTMCAMGFETLIVTNGSRFNDKGVRRALQDCRRNVHLRVSIDACSPATHCRSHGLDEPGCYDEIVAATRSLIGDELQTTVSILLHSFVVEHEDFAAACRKWKADGAMALALRPVTRPEGRDPLAGKDCGAGYIKAISDIVNDPDMKGFAHMPEWFEERLRALGDPTQPVPTEEPKDYNTCYSAFYRMVVSPEADKEGTQGAKDNEMAAVSSARLSWCSYRRDAGNDPEGKFGAEYPDDLAAWLRDKRLAFLSKVDPHKDCGKVFCCRHGLNTELHESLR